MCVCVWVHMHVCLYLNVFACYLSVVEAPETNSVCSWIIQLLGAHTHTHTQLIKMKTFIAQNSWGILLGGQMWVCSRKWSPIEKESKMKSHQAKKKAQEWQLCLYVKTFLFPRIWVMPKILVNIEAVCIRSIHCCSNCQFKVPQQALVDAGFSSHLVG